MVDPLAPTVTEIAEMKEAAGVVDVVNEAAEGEVVDTRTWEDLSVELGLALYERQPEETDREWTVWVKYRSYYPLPVPTWSVLARELGLSVAFVTNTSRKWNFRSRMIQWAKRVDSEDQEKRIVAIRAMNEKQLSMAQRLQDKVSQAIDTIEPALLRPSEVVNLGKFAVELERHINEYREEKVETDVSGSASAAAPPAKKTEDLVEVMKILQQTGIVGIALAPPADGGAQ